MRCKHFIVLLGNMTHSPSVSSAGPWFLWRDLGFDYWQEFLNDCWLASSSAKACYVVFSHLIHSPNRCCLNIPLAQTSKASVVDEANNRKLYRREEAFRTVNCLLNVMKGFLFHKCLILFLQLILNNTFLLFQLRMFSCSWTVFLTQCSAVSAAISSLLHWIYWSTSASRQIHGIRCVPDGPAHIWCVTETFQDKLKHLWTGLTFNSNAKFDCY